MTVTATSTEDTGKSASVTIKVLGKDAIAARDIAVTAAAARVNANFPLAIVMPEQDGATLNLTIHNSFRASK